MRDHTMQMELTRERLSLYRELNRFYFTGFFRAFAFALPLVLLAVPGPVRILGIVYLGFWIALVAASTGAIFALLYDALLILRNRAPIILPQLLFASDKSTKQQPVRAAERKFRRLAALSYWANPLSNFTVALMLFAIRMRPEIIRRVAMTVTEWESDQDKIIIGGEPTVGYVSPAIDQAVGPAVSPERQRELQLA